MATNAAMALSSHHEPCCLSIMTKSMPLRLKSSALGGDPIPSANPNAGWPATIFSFAEFRITISFLDWQNWEPRSDATNGLNHLET